MKPITLKLKPQNILQRIHTYTFYTGETKRETGIPAMLAARMQTSQDDSTQLLDHLKTAIGEVSRILSHYLATCTTINDGDIEHPEVYTILFKIKIPDNYPEESLNQIEETIENYATSRTLQLWMSQHSPADNITISEESQKHMLILRELCSQRTRPMPKRSNINKIIKF